MKEKEEEKKKKEEKSEFQPIPCLVFSHIRVLLAVHVSGVDLCRTKERSVSLES
jgi:hypothetical protein